MGLNNRKAAALMFLAPMIWGISFSFQSMVAGHIGPFSFNAMRMAVGVLCLLPLTVVSVRRRGRQYLKKLAYSGAFAGILLFVACFLQQAAMVTTTAGKSSFITSLYVLFVPIITFFMGRKARASTWFCVAVAVVGAYLLCMDGEAGISKGDILVLLCAVVFAFHLLAVEKLGSDLSGIDFCAVQFATCVVLGFVSSFIAGEKVSGETISRSILPILYTGVFSCGVAYTIQIVCQKYVSATKIALIMSLESVWGALGGALILGERMSPKQTAGCVLMFAAVLFSQLNAERGA